MLRWDYYQQLAEKATFHLSDCANNGRNASVKTLQELKQQKQARAFWMICGCQRVKIKYYLLWWEEWRPLTLENATLSLLTSKFWNKNRNLHLRAKLQQSGLSWNLVQLVVFTTGSSASTLFLTFQPLFMSFPFSCWHFNFILDFPKLFFQSKPSPMLLYMKITGVKFPGLWFNSVV